MHLLACFRRKLLYDVCVCVCVCLFVCLVQWIHIVIQYHYYKNHSTQIGEQPSPKYNTAAVSNAVCINSSYYHDTSYYRSKAAMQIQNRSSLKDTNWQLFLHTKHCFLITSMAVGPCSILLVHDMAT